MDWDNPSERAALIERVGIDEYERLFKIHRTNSVVATVNGRSIWPVNSRFGRVFMIEGLNAGHATLEGAKAMALKALPLSKH